MSTARHVLGFSWPTLVGLAALAAPRVVLHDLGVVEEGTVVNALLVFVPPACWIAAVMWRRPPRPFLSMLVVGGLYGAFLAAGHQLLWDTAFEEPPRRSAERRPAPIPRSRRASCGRLRFCPVWSPVRSSAPRPASSPTS
jgi:hypothetical protein